MTHVGYFPSWALDLPELVLRRMSDGQRCVNPRLILIIVPCSTQIQKCSSTAISGFHFASIKISRGSRRLISALLKRVIIFPLFLNWMSGCGWGRLEAFCNEEGPLFPPCDSSVNEQPTAVLITGHVLPGSSHKACACFNVLVDRTGGIVVYYRGNAHGSRQEHALLTHRV